MQKNISCKGLTMVYLLWDMVAWHSRDSCHEVAGDEGTNHHGAPA